MSFRDGRDGRVGQVERRRLEWGTVVSKLSFFITYFSTTVQFVSIKVKPIESDKSVTFSQLMFR